jgi:hypothetical protein
MDEQATREVPQNDASSARQGEASALPTSVRLIDLAWPAVAVVLLTSWLAVRSAESWTTVALLCGPPALLYAALEYLRQRRVLSHGRRSRLLPTSPLVLLATSVAWWLALLPLTHFSALLAVLFLGPCFAVAELALGYAVLLGLLGYKHLAERRPWMGIAFGLVGLGLVGAWFVPIALEYGKLLAQGGPVPLPCSEAAQRA